MSRFLLSAQREGELAGPVEECASETCLQAAIARRVYDPAFVALHVTRVADEDVAEAA